MFFGNRTLASGDNTGTISQNCEVISGYKPIVAGYRANGNILGIHPLKCFLSDDGSQVQVNFENFSSRERTFNASCFVIYIRT